MAEALEIINTPKATYPASGESPAAVYVQLPLKDDEILLWIPTGTGTTAGALCKIVLGGNYSSIYEGAVPPFVWSLIGVKARKAGLYLEEISSNSILLVCESAPTVSLPATLNNGLGIVLRR
jgi:hypothetical protein